MLASIDRVEGLGAYMRAHYASDLATANLDGQA
jgi:hypothetical protein